MTDTTKTGGFAFPHSRVWIGGGNFEEVIPEDGMTLRDWFAGQALAAMIAKAPFFDRDNEFGQPVDMVQFKRDMSESAYCYADAMIAARGEA